MPLTGDGGVEPGYPVGTPVPLPAKIHQVLGFNRNQVTSSVPMGIRLPIRAPATVNGSANATVSLILNAPVTGTFMLLSNIEIVGDGLG